jgi:hypothetical protein
MTKERANNIYYIFWIGLGFIPREEPWSFYSTPSQG